MDALGRVLLIAEAQEVAARLSEPLAALGYAVRWAETGSSGLQLLASFEPDIVLLDLQLPDMTGPEVLDRLRATQCRLPVIVLSRNGDEELARALLARGVFDYLCKPFEPAVVRRVVAAAVAGQAGQDLPGGAGLP